MSNISFGNINSSNQNTSPELQKRIESGENFGAIDKQKLKEDTVEITQTAVKENFVFKIMRNVFGVKDPKKLLTSIGLTAVTAVAFAAMGNMSVRKMTNLGLDLDKILKNNDLYNKLTGFLKKTTGKIGDFFKKNSKTIDDVADTIKNRRAQPVQTFAKGTGQGFKIQFAYTLPDMLEALPLKAQGETFKTLKKALGKKDAIDFVTTAANKGVDKNTLIQSLTSRIGDSAKATQIVDEVLENNKKLYESLIELVGDKKADTYLQHCINVDRKDVRKFADTLTDDIASNFLGKNYSKEELAKLLMSIKAGEKVNGVDFSKFNGITMNREGILGGWWPYNIINSIGKKFNGGKDIRFTKGSLGDALLKYNVSAGKCADTALGKFTQNLLLIPGESVSNFCCDAAGMNFFVLTALLNLFNTAQDAPKEQRMATIADDFVGSIGSLVITMPIASALTYGLASLKNVNGNGFISKYLLKPAGKFFAMGLDAASNKTWKNLPARFGGGLLRFILIMFAFQPIVAKPINALIHKIFGKPYDADEAKKAQELEAQKNQIIPELGITQGEFLQKIESNPQALQKLENDPELLMAAQKNPKIILDLLDNKEVKIPEQKPHPASQGQLISPINRSKISGNQMNHNNASVQKVAATNQPAQNTNTGRKTLADTATYIPSSAFTAPAMTLSPEQQNEYNAAMTRADKLLRKAEEFI